MQKIDLRRIDLNLLVVFDVLMTEGSVTRVAARLGRTQSALSHALARLREQLDDPLLVKIGGRMEPSPFALQLVEDVRPILASIQRVLVPAQGFDPLTSTRHFRVAIPDLTDSLFPRLAERVQRAAPSATLEWVLRDTQALWGLAEGQVDIALVPTMTQLPEGLDRTEVKPFRWGTFARRGHPAIKTWGRAAWSRWPHAAVRVNVKISSPVDAAISPSQDRRRIAAWVPHFSAVAPLLARTNLLATLPVLVTYESLKRHRLVALRVPIPIEPMPHQLVWSRRLGNNPAIRWLRDHVEAVFREALDAADLVMPN